jgi:hypothetical protein
MDQPVRVEAHERVGGASLAADGLGDLAFGPHAPSASSNKVEHNALELVELGRGVARAKGSLHGKVRPFRALGSGDLLA